MADLPRSQGQARAQCYAHECFHACVPGHLYCLDHIPWGRLVTNEQLSIGRGVLRQGWTLYQAAKEAGVDVRDLDCALWSAIGGLALVEK